VQQEAGLEHLQFSYFDRLVLCVAAVLVSSVTDLHKCADHCSRGRSARR